MKRVDLRTLDPETLFKIKMEAYLYIDAGKMLNFGKGDPKKLRNYMKERIEIIEELLRISKPFKIVEGKETLLEVGK
ncbi:MAG: hypothetical protein M1161_05335 [Candidatus Thermoplasmatota archaeon]|jgi:hypothetical protein|nr:hypothetical protein [Candidatus Thermoplasmatota archaeon]